MLTDAEIRGAKAGDKLAKLSDGKGLFLELAVSGSKFWRYRYKLGGKEGLFALGEYAQPTTGETKEAAEIRRDGRRFTLAEARTERDKCRDLVKQGIAPAQNQRAEKIRRSIDAGSTFKVVAEAWIKEAGAQWSESYKKQVERRLSGDAYPVIGDLPIKDVNPANVLEVLKRVRKRSPTMAGLLKTWISGVFRYAASNLLVETDPTWPLRDAIKAAKVKHHPHLTAKEVPAFLRALEDVQAEHQTLIAIRLLWLTAVRTIELRGAEWVEIDFDAGLWHIPAARMKMREAHTVPLSAQAIEQFKAIQALTGRGGFVFPGRNNRDLCLSHQAIRDVFKRAGYGGKFTPHGIRSTFSTYWNEAGADSDLIEMSLAHKERNAVRASYNHAKRLDQRRAMMQQWADLTDAWRDGAEIVPIRRVA